MFWEFWKYSLDQIWMKLLSTSLHYFTLRYTLNWSRTSHLGFVVPICSRYTVFLWTVLFTFRVTQQNALGPILIVQAQQQVQSFGTVCVFPNACSNVKCIRAGWSGVYKLEGVVVINTHTFSQSHHWFHSSWNSWANNNISSTNGKMLLWETTLLSEGAECCQKHNTTNLQPEADNVFFTV